MGEGGTFLAGTNPLAEPIGLFLVQILLIVVLSRVLAIGLGYLKQPRVIAEVIGGILLGPSLCSRSQAFKDNVFPKESLPRLSLIANFSLILFLFLVGIELDPTTVFKKFRQSAAISLTGIALPFAVGVGVSHLIYENLADQNVPFTSFFVFLGVAMSITAFPVLARILTETKLIQTSVGQITLASAAVDDGIAWCLLILVVALINNPSNSVQALYVFLVVIAWGLFLWFAIRPILMSLVNRSAGSDSISHLSVLVTFIVILVSSFFTQAAGVHAIFGAFLAGLITPHDHGFAIKLTEKIEDLVTMLLLPLYFAYSGLNTNIGMLNDGESWAYTILVIVAACGGKLIGCTAAARLTGFGWRESLASGILMNTKGLVELIVLNLGYSAGVINQKIFTMFVIMALVTTFMTTPLVTWVYPPKIYLKQSRAITHDTLSSIAAKDDMSPYHHEGGPDDVKVVICLPNMHAVPPMMSITQMFQTAKHRVQVYALRLIKLTERTSTYMMAANATETMRADPVVNVFRTFSQLNHVGSVTTLVSVSHTEDFAAKVVETANDANADLVVVPWHVPVDPDTNKVLGMQTSPLSEPLVKDVLAIAPCTVGVFIDRGFGVNQSTLDERTDMDIQRFAEGKLTQQTVLVPFFGTRECYESLRFVTSLAAQSGILVVVLHVQPYTSKSLDDMHAVRVTPTSTKTLSTDASPVGDDLPKDQDLIADSKSTGLTGHDAFKALRRAAPILTVEVITSIDPLQDIVTRGTKLGRKDLIVIGHDAYYTSVSPPVVSVGGMRRRGVVGRWADEECASSVVVIRKGERWEEATKMV
ncbi:Sodium/hydrogen exchanger family-domain-containing protein [Gaertneriomyces semiglobifer]|nr:Sodium/hydrogen exchanger family-domain-containing protein [Gaertneriomyces semiglobifer]